MDKSTMAVRIALLTLMTCTFAAIWSEDRPDELSSANFPKKANPPSVQPRSTSPTIAPQASDSSLPDDVLIPLPDGIYAGTYLVADQYGRTVTRIVSFDNVPSRSKSANDIGRDHYTVKMNESCWHYIRISEKMNDRLAAEPSNSVVR